MAEELEARKRNDTLDDAIIKACEEEGLHWFKCFRIKLALRRMSDEEHLKLEKTCTDILVDSKVALPVGYSIVGGVLVGDWQSFIQMLIDNLPKILDFIAKLLPLFIAFATFLLALCLFIGTASAQCNSVGCRRPVLTRPVVIVDEMPVIVEVRPIRSVIVAVHEFQPVRTIIQGVTVRQPVRRTVRAMLPPYGPRFYYEVW